MAVKKKKSRNGSKTVPVSEMYKNVDKAILDYLKQNPWSRTEEIAVGLATDSVNVSPFISKFRNEGIVKAAGVRRGTRYALKAERSRPPAAA